MSGRKHRIFKYLHLRIFAILTAFVKAELSLFPGREDLGASTGASSVSGTGGRRAASSSSGTGGRRAFPSSSGTSGCRDS